METVMNYNEEPQYDEWCSSVCEENEGCITCNPFAFNDLNEWVKEKEEEEEEEEEWCGCPCDCCAISDNDVDDPSTSEIVCRCIKREEEKKEEEEEEEEEEGELDENRCDCCCKSWNNDAPIYDICNCWHTNHLLRDCRYVDCVKLEKELEEEIEKTCDCCGKSWINDLDIPCDVNKICHCFHGNHRLIDCRYKKCAIMENQGYDPDECPDCKDYELLKQMECNKQ